MLQNLFEITRPGGQTTQGILPNVAASVGVAFMVSSVDADTGARTLALANGKADGFLVRDVRVPTDGINGNPRTDAEILYNEGLEVPFTGGREGTLEWGSEVEAEGTTYLLTSGTGALSTGTAADVHCSFKNGRFYEAQSGDTAQFRVVAQMTPINSGAVRIKFAEVAGYLVA